LESWHITPVSVDLDLEAGFNLNESLGQGVKMAKCSECGSFTQKRDHHNTIECRYAMAMELKASRKFIKFMKLVVKNHDKKFAHYLDNCIHEVKRLLSEVEKTQGSETEDEQTTRSS
jgi:hypothetical protein